MNAKFTLTGGPQLRAALEAVAVAITREVQLEILTKAAEPIRATAASLAPRSKRSTPHLADDIVISAPTVAQLERRERFDEVVVEVGPSKKPHDHFYGYFQEYGTVKHPAQPFMRPAFDQQGDASLKAIIDAFWHLIEAEAAKGPK